MWFLLLKNILKLLALFLVMMGDKNASMMRWSERNDIDTSTGVLLTFWWFSRRIICFWIIVDWGSLKLWKAKPPVRGWYGIPHFKILLDLLPHFNCFDSSILELRYRTGNCSMEIGCPDSECRKFCPNPPSRSHKQVWEKLERHFSRFGYLSTLLKSTFGNHNEHLFLCSYQLDHLFFFKCYLKDILDIITENKLFSISKYWGQNHTTSFLNLWSDL